jgi:hypothetical protein
LAAAGFQSTVNITDATPDTTAPSVTSVTFSQQGASLATNLVVPGPSFPITVNLQTNDIPSGGGASSGLGYDGYSGCSPYLSLASQNQYSNSTENSTQYRSVSFTPTGANSWVGTLTFPSFSEIGQWNASLSLCDRVGNYSYFTGPTSFPKVQNAFVYVLYQTPQATGTLAPTNATSLCDGTGACIDDRNGGIPAGTSTYISTTPVPPTAACSNDPAQACAPPAPVFTGFKSTNSPYVDFTFVDSSGNPLPSATVFPYPGVTITIPGVVTAPAIIGPSPSLVLWAFDLGQPHAALGCRTSSNTYMSINATVINTNGDVAFSNVCEFSVFYVLKKVSLPGDVNGDGAVTCADVSIVKAAFGSRVGQPGYVAMADVNSDGVINIVDLAYVTKQLPTGTVCQ